MDVAVSLESKSEVESPEPVRPGAEPDLSRSAIDMKVTDLN